MSDSSSPSFLRIPEVAKRLGVSDRTVKRLLAAGHLTRVKVRGCTCITLSDLRAYMERVGLEAAQ